MTHDMDVHVHHRTHAHDHRVIILASGTPLLDLLSIPPFVSPITHLHLTPALYQ